MAQTDAAVELITRVIGSLLDEVAQPNVLLQVASRENLTTDWARADELFGGHQSADSELSRGHRGVIAPLIALLKEAAPARR